MIVVTDLGPRDRAEGRGGAGRLKSWLRRSAAAALGLLAFSAAHAHVINPGRNPGQHRPDNLQPRLDNSHQAALDLHQPVEARADACSGTARGALRLPGGSHHPSRARGPSGRSAQPPAAAMAGGGAEGRGRVPVPSARLQAPHVAGRGAASDGGMEAVGVPRSKDSISGKRYLERGSPVRVLVRWSGKGPRNVLIERQDGSRVVRPFRGLRSLERQNV